MSPLVCIMPRCLRQCSTFTVEYNAVRCRSECVFRWAWLISQFTNAVKIFESVTRQSSLVAFLRFEVLQPGEEMFLVNPRCISLLYLLQSFCNLIDMCQIINSVCERTRKILHTAGYSYSLYLQSFCPCKIHIGVVLWIYQMKRVNQVNTSDQDQDLMENKTEFVPRSVMLILCQIGNSASAHRANTHHLSPVFMAMHNNPEISPCQSLDNLLSIQISSPFHFFQSFIKKWKCSNRPLHLLQ